MSILSTCTPSRPGLQLGERVADVASVIAADGRVFFPLFFLDLRERKHGFRGGSFFPELADALGHAGVVGLSRRFGVRKQNVLAGVPAVIVFLDDGLGGVPVEQLLGGEQLAPCAGQFPKQVRAVPSVHPIQRPPAVIAADDADRGFPFVEVGPVRQQSGRETHVGMVAVEGKEKINSVLAVDFVDGFRSFSGTRRHVGLGVQRENGRIGVTGLQLSQVGHLAKVGGVLPDFHAGLVVFPAEIKRSFVIGVAAQHGGGAGAAMIESGFELPVRIRLPLRVVMTILSQCASRVSRNTSSPPPASSKISCSRSQSACEVYFLRSPFFQSGLVSGLRSGWHE